MPELIVFQKQPTESEKEIISDLIDIKLSIMKNSEDVLWMAMTNETVCERIDSILLRLGVPDNVIQNHYVWSDQDE